MYICSENEIIICLSVCSCTDPIFVISLKLLDQLEQNFQGLIHVSLACAHDIDLIGMVYWLEFTSIIHN